jgi:excisionase family DNA binding protein
VVNRYQEEEGQPIGEPAVAASGRDALLTPSEVAEMFRVNPKTVTRWARAGKISTIWTLGGHRRFRTGGILAQRRDIEPAES